MKDIIGHWELIKFEAVGDVNIIYPFGQNVRGLLYYGLDGRMSAQLGNVIRVNFKNPDFRFADDIEVKEAYNGYISYFGKYSVNELRKYIIHDVEMSLYPNWIGTRVKRFYELKDDFLILTASKLDYEGIYRIPTLTWKKII